MPRPPRAQLHAGDLDAGRNRLGSLAPVEPVHVSCLLFMNLTCADCDKPLKRGVLVRSAGTVHFNACSCGGLWIADSHLERLLGHAAPRARRKEVTPRRCPSCRGGLTAIQLPRGIACETCAACKGVWLDAPDFPQLAVKGFADAAAAATAVSATTLRCSKCQTRLTAATRIPTPKGDFCTRCAPAGSRPSVTSGRASSASSLSFEAFEATSSEPSLTASIIGVLFDLATDFDD
jgi:Zn-finger nucleic acid-binding protein